MFNFKVFINEKQKFNIDWDFSLMKYLFNTRASVKAAAPVAPGSETEPPTNEISIKEDSPEALDDIKSALVLFEDQYLATVRP